MKLNDAALQTPGFAEYAAKAGFITGDGELSASGRIKPFPGEIRLSDDYIAESGGLLRAVSRKSAEILRRDLEGLEIRGFPQEILDGWRYILMHSRPHLDEYLASFVLRSCLPDGMCALRIGETALFSAEDDREAKALWPQAAVLGVGNVVSGGAQARLLFDEHEAGGEKKTVSSLVMLMKRYMLGNQKPPYALYQMLRETNYIDQYGTVHPKSIAGYVKYLQNIPLATTGEFMCAEWKAAIVDACLAAFYLALKTPGLNFRSRMSWENCMRASLDDFVARTPLKHSRDFDVVYRKVSSFMTDGFARRAAQGDLKYVIPSPQNPQKGAAAELNMLIPYLPRLCFRFWGSALTQLLLCPLWECRFASELASTSGYRLLKRLIPAGRGEVNRHDTEIGTLTVRCCRNSAVDRLPLKIIELEPKDAAGAPSPVNQYVRADAGGSGFTIFHNAGTGNIVLSKGDKIPPVLWEKVCDRLVEMEGLSDDPLNCGAWHVTRNPTGIAPFLLNGNPTHRYVPKSAINAEMLARIVDECLSGTKA